jgi:hypothetical protein
MNRMVILKKKEDVLLTSVADPDPVLFGLLDLGSRSGMNIPDHISEGLVTIFWVKNT